jgi:hypothetical protein
VAVNIKKDCIFYVRSMGRDLCALKAATQPTASMDELFQGCPEDCPDYKPDRWAVNVLEDPT